MSQTQITREKKISKEVLSVLLIVSSDFYLQQSTREFINITDQTINWKALFKLPLSESHKAALVWAHCIWKNEIPPNDNPFVMASAMDAELKKVVLEALKFRWFK